MAEMIELGAQGLRVPRIGLGVMSIAFYGSGDTERDEAQQLAALDRLVELCAPNPCFVDTAFVYSHPTGLHSEAIVGKAIAKHGREKFVVATKFGISDKGVDSCTETIHSQYAASIERLGCTPDLYYQHRCDPKRPIEEVMKDLRAMHADGKFKYVGLSECTPDELRRAHAIFPVSCIQMEWSLAERSIEKTHVPVCKELGIGLVCFSPLAKGILTSTLSSVAALDSSDRRHVFPRFSEDMLARNKSKAEAFAALAASKGCTAAQLALAWLLAQGRFVVPIPGTKSPARVEENMGAIAVAARLTPEDLAAIEALDLKAEGARYPPQYMAIAHEARM